MCPASSGKKEKVKLRIADVFKEDVGRGIIRIDPRMMNKLKLEMGDVIEVYNEHKKKRTVGSLESGNLEDTDSGVIRLESSLRWNLRAHIDDWVTIRKIKVKSAKNITLKSVGKPIDNIDSINLAKLLNDHVVTKGDIINVYFMGQRYDFKIIKHSPRTKVVRIHSKTKIIISDKIINQKIGVEIRSMKDVFDDDLVIIEKIKMEEMPPLKRKLEKMRKLLPEIEDAAISNKSGLPIVSTFSRLTDESRIAAFTGAFLSIGERVIQTMLNGKLKHILIRGTKGFLIIMRIDENSVLFLSTTVKVNLGLIFEAIQEFLG